MQKPLCLTALLTYSLFLTAQNAFCEDLFLEGIIEPGIYYSDGKITVSPNSTVQIASQVTLVTPYTVIIGTGFRAATGSQFTVTIGEMEDIDTGLDIDADELPDWWEQHFFGDISQGRDSDYDQDGITNYIEYALGTDPLNAEDRPASGVAYVYDTLNRLTCTFYLSDTDSYEIQYEYDVQGNRTQKVMHSLQP